MTQMSPKSHAHVSNGMYSPITTNGQLEGRSPLTAPPPPPPQSYSLQNGGGDEILTTGIVESLEADNTSQPSGTSLRNQLLRIFLPLTLGPLAIASFVGYRVIDGYAQQNARNHLSEVASVAGDATLRFVDDSLKIPLAVASNPLIVQKANAWAEQVAASGLDQQPIEALEQRFAETRSLSIDPTLNAYMQRVVENEGIDKLHVTQKDGFVFTYSIPTGDFVQSDEEWWQNAQANTTWIQPPEVDPSTGEFSVDFSQAVIDPNSGQFLGVVQAVISAETFNRSVIDLLEDLELERSEQVQIVDATTGLVIGTVQADGVADRPDITGGEAIQQASAALSEASKNPGAGVQQVLDGVSEQHGLRRVEIFTYDAAVGGQILEATFNYQGKEYDMVAIPNADWVAISSVDIADIRAAGRNLALILVLMAVPLSGAAVFLVLWLANQLTEPIKGLSGTAERVSLGDLNVVAEPQGSSETKTLAQSFNTLVARVRNFLDEQKANAEKARLLAEVSSSPALNLAELFETLNAPLGKARDLLAADRLVVFQLTPAGQGNVVLESAGSGWFRDLEKRLQNVSLPEQLLDLVQDGRIVSIDERLMSELPPDYVKLLQRLSVKNSLVAPIVAGNQMLGLLVADHCTAPQPWDASQVDFLRQLAAQLGLIIDRVNLLNTTETQAEEQRQLKEGLQRRALELLQEVDPISQGDLTVRAKVTADEIGTVADSYNAIVGSLRQIVGQVKAAATQVAETTTANERSVLELSEDASRQVNDISAALDELEQMNEAIRQVAMSAEKAETAVQRAAQTVQEGDLAMNQTVDGIQAIRETVAETAKKVKHLGESSQKISTVVELISAFAAQTNMLALNASIEASRAGEEGRGFAVVAEEVRGLARKSAEATEEIRKLVATIQVETNEVVAAMESGTEKVVTGTKLVDTTRQNLNQITAASTEISSLVEAIAQSTIVQSQAAERVTKRMKDVAAVSSKTSVGATEVSDSFKELREVAQTLQEGVGQFKVE